MGPLIAEQDVAEVARRTESLMVELDPKSTVGKALVGQLAVLSVRMERSTEQIDAATRSNVRRAVETFDHGRVDQAEATFDAIAQNPRTSVRLLKRSPEGIDRLVEAWGELRHALTRAEGPTWGEPELAMATSLLGCRPGQFEAAWVESLSKQTKGDPSAFGLLIELVDEQVAALEAHRETHNLEVIELDRLEAPLRAWFDASREACLARRYESDANRRFFRVLKELRRAEAEFEAPGSAATSARQPEPTSAPASQSLGSFRAAILAELEAEDDDPDESLGPIGQMMGQAQGLDRRVPAVGRAVVETSSAQ